MTTQPYHHGDLRRTLLEAAALSVEAGGADALSLRQLARDAGVSHAAPGRHFRDKQALLDALAEDGFRRLAAELEAIASEPIGSQAAARRQFDALTRCYIDFARAQPALLTLMYGMKHAPEARVELLEAGHASLEVTMIAIVNMQAIAAIGPGPAEEIALAVFASIHGVATLISGGFIEAGASETLITRAGDLLWRGLQAPA